MMGQAITFQSPQQGSLKRVEQITPEEKVELQKARDAIAKANSEYEAAKAKVAGAHKMTQESYMEWSSWYEFDGDFILQRFSSHQGINVGW